MQKVAFRVVWICGERRDDYHKAADKEENNPRRVAAPGRTPEGERRWVGGGGRRQGRRSSRPVASHEFLVRPWPFA